MSAVFLPSRVREGPGVGLPLSTGPINLPYPHPRPLPQAGGE